MFIRKSTHYRIVDAVREGGRIVIRDQARTIRALQAQLAERQVPAVRGQRGRFVKREG